MAAIDLVRIEPGSFIMGSPATEPGRMEDETAHEVRLTRPFQIGSTPLTQAQCEEVWPDHQSRHRGPELPVERLTWYQAIQLCNLLSAREGLELAYSLTGEDNVLLSTFAEHGGESFTSLEATVFRVEWRHESKGYRLLSEAEWEYAARAGETHRWAGSDDADEVAWHSGNCGGLLQRKSRPVAQKKPNAWGLYDMCGNVAEWVWDVYAPYPGRAQVDPVGPPGAAFANHEAKERLCRGGSFQVSREIARVACRYTEPGARGAPPTEAQWDRGVRLARSL